MATRITKTDFMGGSVEVEQKHIDYWCNLCQYPDIEGKCKTKEQIQLCWDTTQAGGNRWHNKCECPFVHRGLECHCNDFKTIKDAFKSLGMEYS